MRPSLSLSLYSNHWRSVGVFSLKFFLCSCPQSIKLVVKLVPQLTLATEKAIYLIANKMAQL